MRFTSINLFLCCLHCLVLIYNQLIEHIVSCQLFSAIIIYETLFIFLSKLFTLSPIHYVLIIIQSAFPKFLY